MPSTPPAQIRVEARTPPTPLHGSAYHGISSPSRYNTRSTTRLASDSTNSSFTHSPKSSRTPRSPRDTQLHPHSPQATPQRKSTRRIHVISPDSPNSISDFPAQPLFTTQNHNFLSATTIMSEAMLPTPAKTPQKKHIPKSAMAARVLFQDQIHPARSSPRKQIKKRHNGFSLERDATPTDEVAIFTDSRDQVPHLDQSPSNPFYSAPKSKKRLFTLDGEPTTTAGPSKRRKLASKDSKKPDPQVQEAIRNDEGMVYLFRGKKVYRRFEDAGDEEEVIDHEELGLLGRRHGAREIIKPLKTLTRKSIQPRRLFQEANQPSQSDEEAETEIEDNHEPEHETHEVLEQPSPSRSTRSQVKKISGGSGKKTSPFDSWRRLKSGSGSSSARGRKTTAGEALEV